MNNPENQVYPPKIAHWILKRTISRDIQYGALGDFEEIYEQTVLEKGELQAKLWFWMETLKSLPPFIRDLFFWRLSMLKNYLKITLRNIKKNKVHYFINIVGLSVGLAVFIFIASFVLNEINHDKFHKNLNRIYQIGTGWHNGTSGPMAVLLKSNFPEIQSSVRFRYSYGSKIYRKSGKNFKIERVYYVDPDFLRVFSFPLIKGNSETALNEPLSLVLTRSEAEKIFDQENPLGKIVNYEEKDLMVTAVIEDVPQNSTIQFNALLSFKALEQINPAQTSSWGNLLFQTYFLIAEVPDASELEKRMSQFMYSRYAGYENWQQSRKERVEFSLRPLSSLYFDIDRGGNYIHGNIQNIKIFSVVAFFVLCLALINFINLSTATASVRFKEVGVRKVLGSSRTQLLKQFLFESIFLSLSASLIALLLFGLTKAKFFQIIGKQIDFSYLINPEGMALFILFIILIGFISGIYPALFLSSFQPAAVLREGKRKGARGGFFRRVMAVVQFAVSVVLIIGTLTVGNQLKFMQNKDLGFNQDQILWFELNDTSMKHAGVLKQRLASDPNVLGVATTNFTKPGIWSKWDLEWQEKQMDVNVFLVDPDYIKTMGLEIVEGRNFLTRSEKGRAFIFNESAVKEFGMESPIGEVIGGSSLVGVVKDFHYRSLHQKIGPLLLVYEQDFYKIFNVKISMDNVEGAIKSIRSIFNDVLPDAALEYHFYDESFDALYHREKKFEQLFAYFSLFAIFIACLGLFGLASFLVEKKTKEIGIRKILGASVVNMLFFLSKEFMKWVLLASLFAWPVAYYAMHKWLGNFAYRTGMHLWIFITASLSVVVIAFLTISSKAVKAAYSDPVDSLRYE